MLASTANLFYSRSLNTGSIFAVILSFWLVPMVAEALRFRFMVRPSADLYILSASAMDFLVPNRLHTLFRPESFTWIGNQIAPVSERTIAIGYVALGLAGVAFVLARRKAAFWWSHRHSGFNSRQQKLLNRLLDAEPEGFTGGMTLRKAISLTKVSRATAWRDLAELVDLQAIEPIGEGRSRAYRIRWHW